MPETRRPNVLFIMSDQHNANCMSGAGRPEVRTPTLDAIAESGVRFDRAYCNNPICAPSRHCYFLGQYCHTHRMFGNNVFEFPGDAPDTVAAHLRKYGYQTALLGKGHMVKRWDEAGFEHRRYCDLTDTDRADVLTNHYFKYLVDHGLADRYEDGTLPADSETRLREHGVAQLPYEHGIEHWTGEETLAFLRGRDRRRPFFTFMSFERPHPNFTPAAEHADMYDPESIPLPESAADAYELDFASKPEPVREILRERRVDPDHLRRILAAYYALVTVIDSEIGRVVDLLRAEGELDNTIVIYTADHGDFAGDHGIFRKNIGTYESIHRVPFLFCYPGGPKGVTRDGIIESVDVYPTLCELCDVPTPDHVDGRSFAPVAAGEADGKDFAICEWDWWIQPELRVNSIRTRSRRLTYYDSEIGGELYDNERDPGELHNQWSDPAHREARMALTELLFDQVAHYGLRTGVFSDRAIAHATRATTKELIHKRCRTWSEVKRVCYD